METIQTKATWGQVAKELTRLNFNTILKFFNVVAELGFFIVGGLQWIL